jgi:hypothetical protein
MKMAGKEVKVEENESDDFVLYDKSDESDLEEVKAGMEDWSKLLKGQGKRIELFEKLENLMLKRF